MNMFFMTLIPITSLYPDAPNSIFPTLEKFGQPQTIIGIFDPKHQYFLLVCLLLFLDVEQILFVTLNPLCTGVAMKLHENTEGIRFSSFTLSSAYVKESARKGFREKNIFLVGFETRIKRKGKELYV